MGNTARKLPGSGATDNMGATTTFGPLVVTGRQLTIVGSWTGTPTGTFSLEGTVDGTTWFTIPGSAAEFTANSQAQPAGGASSGAWTWINIPASQVRLKYTRTGGTGTLTAYQVQVD